ncbi:MAG: hypothetical protein MZW92_08770 [Comamonadaceae bacterium]|nr:hypothetical protein [Comamonadaceae bacterium]
MVGRNGAGKSSLFALLDRHACTPTAATSRSRRSWRIGEVAQDMPETEQTAPPTSCSQGDMPLLPPRRPSWPPPRPRDDGHAHGRRATWRSTRPARFDAAPRAQALLLGLGFQVARARRAGRTASPAAGACACSWRAR